MRALLFVVAFCSFPLWAGDARLHSTLTARGETITRATLTYPRPLVAGGQFAPVFAVAVLLDGQEVGTRTVQKAAVDPADPRTVILTLSPDDERALPYAIERHNDTPLAFRARDAVGKTITIHKKQATKVPIYYGARLVYRITQRRPLASVDGANFPPATWQATGETLDHGRITQFAAGHFQGTPPANGLNYRLYTPPANGRKPYLLVFLHGSGQVGKDNLAPLISSRGAVATLDYESGFVLVPQYDGVFDPFDPTGGIHWQTANRRRLLWQLIDQILTQHPEIDRTRIYLTGLSRGAEGGLALLLDRPHFFAGALLMSGREAGTVEWLDGNATADMLRPLQEIPIWFFHSPEDPIAPFAGTRKNVAILRDQLHNSRVKFTAVHFQAVGDNGIVHNNAHNTWDMVFSSPAALSWLLQQRNRSAP